MDGVQLLQDKSHFEEAIYFITLSSQKFLILILSTLEGWKAESTLQPPNGFDPEIPGLGIQHLNHLLDGWKCWMEKKRMLDRKKENNTVCSPINWPSNLVNNVFVSVHYLGFNIKLLFFFTCFSPQILGVSLTLWQKVVNTAGGIFYQVVEPEEEWFWWFENFSKQHFVNTEHQLKSKIN